METKQTLASVSKSPVGVWLPCSASSGASRTIATPGILSQTPWSVTKEQDRRPGQNPVQPWWWGCSPPGFSAPSWDSWPAGPSSRSGRATGCGCRCCRAAGGAGRGGVGRVVETLWKRRAAEPAPSPGCGQRPALAPPRDPKRRQPPGAGSLRHLLEVKLLASGPHSFCLGPSGSSAWAV